MSHKIDHDNIADSHITSLYVAVRLIDNYTQKKPVGNVVLSMGSSKITPILNPSGYWLFLKSNNDIFTADSISVKSSNYFDLVRDIDSKKLDSKHPVITISLIPKPHYPFPSYATLLRGMLVNDDGEPISNAKISVDSGMSTISTHKGEFVIYFTDLEKKFNTKENFINNSEVVITLNVSHPDFKEKTVSTKISEGKSVSIVQKLEAEL